MSVKFKPVGRRILVKPATVATQTAGGIHIPEGATDRPDMGVAEAVGAGTEDEPIQVKAGDRVLFTKYGGTPVEIEGEEYLIFNEADILGVVA